MEQGNLLYRGHKDHIGFQADCLTGGQYGQKEFTTWGTI